MVHDPTRVVIALGCDSRLRRFNAVPLLGEVGDAVGYDSRMRDADFWILAILILWVAYDTRDIRKRIGRIEKAILPDDGSKIAK